MSTPVSVLGPATTRRTGASIVKATVICPGSRGATTVPARRRPRSGSAMRAVRRPQTVMKARAITRIIGARSIPGHRRRRGRRCVACLGGLGHMGRRRRRDGAGLTHHLDYASDLVNGDTLGRERSYELHRGSSWRDSTQGDWRCRGSCLRGRHRRRERKRQTWSIYRLGWLQSWLRGRQEWHARLSLYRHWNRRLHGATMRRATGSTEHGGSGRSRSCHVGITLRSGGRGILPRNVCKRVQDAWDSGTGRWCCWLAGGTKRSCEVGRGASRRCCRLVYRQGYG